MIVNGKVVLDRGKHTGAASGPCVETKSVAFTFADHP